MQARAPSLRTLWEGKDPETVCYPKEAPGFRRRRGCAQWRRQAFLLGVAEGWPRVFQGGHRLSNEFVPPAMAI